MLLFRNTLPDGSLDPASLHESRPVITVGAVGDLTHVVKAVTSITWALNMLVCCAFVCGMYVDRMLLTASSPCRRERNGQRQCGSHTLTAVAITASQSCGAPVMRFIDLARIMACQGTHAEPVIANKWVPAPRYGVQSCASQLQHTRRVSCNKIPDKRSPCIAGGQ